MTNRIVVICGPTASGKTALSMRLAAELDAEIINADSMQIYRGMDIGTAKPTQAERKMIPHHLIDIANPDVFFSAADFADCADKAISSIRARGKQVIVTGGTGLYIRALIKGLVDSPSGAGEIRSELQAEAAIIGSTAMLEQLRSVDPASAENIHPHNLVRIIRALEVYRMTGRQLSACQREQSAGNDRYTALYIGIHADRNVLYSRIEQRVDGMIAEGLIDEVRNLLTIGYGRNLKAMRSIGYKEIAAYLAGECTLVDAVRLIKRDTRRYAKRQITWFNRVPNILWLEYPENFVTILNRTIDFFKQQET